MLSTSGDATNIMPTIAINRANRKSKIYIKCAITGIVAPRVYRCYYDDDGVLQRTYKDFGVLTSSTTEYIFNYDPLNDYNFVSYYIHFYGARANTTINVSEIGLIYDSIESSYGNTLEFKSSLTKDINNAVMDFQEIDIYNNFKFIINRSDIGRVLNIIDKPFYLVDIKDDYIDNSSEELICQSINTAYVTSASKYLEVTLNNVGR